MSNETDSKPAGAEHDEKPKLKVTDRRMFDADGNPRHADVDLTEASGDAPSPPDSAAVEETPEAVPAPESAAPAPESAPPAPESAPPVEDPRPAPSAEDSSPAPTADPASPTPADEDSDPTAAAEDSSPDPASENDPTGSGSYADLPRGFAPFVESQYLEALIFLGAVPHPQTGETMEDPEFARYKIDLLTMIQEKTEGNLTAEEGRLIEDVLYQLRMLFVQKTGPAAP